jgi:GntR family transcriptional regulator / MocR family aminotransferase
MEVDLALPSRKPDAGQDGRPARAIAAEAFVPDPDFKGTRQQHIQHLVSHGIASGRFPPGARMPSSRRLGNHLGVSRITVTLAFAGLEADGFLVARSRSGFFVSPTAPRTGLAPPVPPAPATAVDWGRAIARRFTGQVLPDKPADWQSYRYPFIYGQIDETLFDYKSWRLCALEALGRKDLPEVSADAFESDDIELVKYIAMTGLPRRGIAARPSEILITLGAQNALWLVAQILLAPRRRAAMENPGYPGLRAVIEPTGCALAGVPVDDRGLVLEALEPRTDVVFVTPSHQCPTNVTMPLQRRRELLAFAAAHDSLIVEDDYEAEMSFLKPPTASIKSLDRDGRVIYVGSLSKALFPGLRLGYIVAPEPLIREARSLRTAVLRHPPGHLQRTTARFLALGHYDAILARLGEAFAQRRRTMANALQRAGLRAAAAGTAGGSSFWIDAGEGIDSAELARRLRAKSVLIEPGHAFFGPRPARSSLFRIAYSSVAEALIPDGVALIAETLAEMAGTRAAAASAPG